MSRNLVLRGSIWHYRRRVPEDIQPLVGKQWWKSSLATSNRRDAEKSAMALAIEQDELIKKLRGITPQERLHRLDKLETDNFGDPKRKFSPGHRLVAHGLIKTEISILDHLDKTFSEKISRLTQAERDIALRAGNLTGLLRQVNIEAGILAECTDDIEREVRDRHLQQKRSILAKLGLNSYWSEVKQDPANPNISLARDEWFKTRGQGALARKRHTVALRRFTELHGDLNVQSVTREMVSKYVQAIAKLTDHRRIPTVLRGGMTEIEGLPLVAAPTVERHLASLKAFLQFGVERGWLTGNVASGLRPPQDTRPKAMKRRAFTKEERNQILRTALAEHGPDGDMTWLIRLGAYSGARLEELAQLARSNILKVEDVWVIEIDDLQGRQVKSRSSVRHIPIHPAIRMELVAWNCAGRGDRLFSSFRPVGGRFSNKLSGEFARLMERSGLHDPRLVFHSWRHTLKREMSNARVDPDARRLILGHGNRDAHDRYEGHSLGSLNAELERVPELFDL
jgi:integrase